MPDSFPRINPHKHWILAWFAPPPPVVALEWFATDPPDVTLPCNLRTHHTYIGFAFSRTYWTEQRVKTWCASMGQDVLEVLNTMQWPVEGGIS